MKNKAFPALLLSLCLLLPVLAQTTPAPPPQKSRDDQDDTVKITTNLVQIDAVVTKDGKPVTGLTADDFEIYEDGKKQTITSFTYISNVPTSTPVIATKEKPGNVSLAPRPINPNEPHRTIAFVVDDLGISAESMSQVRKQLRKFVNEQLQPNDVVAIIRTGGEMGALQQFTNDKRILSRAVDQLRWNMCNRVGITVLPVLGSGGNQSLCGRYSMIATIRALRFILDSMSYLPGRKSMVFMSDHLPVEDQDDLDFLRDIRQGLKDDVPSTTPMAAGGGEESSDLGSIDSRNYSAALRKVAEKAIRSSVVIYSVDTAGLQTTSLTAADRFYGTGPQFQNVLANRSLLLWSRREGSDLIARQTGGFQVKNSNNYDIDRIMQDQSGYYLLGYRPTDETFNRKFHHIKAKVKRSGMSLRTRLGFFGISEEEASKARLTTRDMTNLALASPFAAQDVEVNLVSFFFNDKSFGSLVRSFVYIAASDLEFAPVNGRQQASIELHGVVFGDNGAMIEQLRRGLTISLPENEYAAATKNGLGFSVDIPVKRNGAFQVRVAIRDRKTSKIGSAGEFVSVPDLRNKRPAVSGIVLGGGSRGRSEREALANTVARRFDLNTDLDFVYVIYNALQFAKPVMETKLFRDGRVIYSGPETPIQITGQPDPDRVVVNGKLRLSPDLEPGFYYLQVVITDKDGKGKVVPVMQWIDFEVVKSEPAAVAPGLN
ncbi:MAG TPA: VWA domain-containing protein [Pyrinomonadaceae bacterium]|nr:VWA domain-containing protein [Pyrinomonadaceae bacterium]